MKRIAILLLSLAFCLPLFQVMAFNGHQVTEGPLTLTIAPVPLVTNYDQSQPVRVTVSNAANAPLKISLVITGLVDECRAVGATQKQLVVPAAGRGEAEFALAVGQGAFSALYPVRIQADFNFNGQPRQTTAIRIFTNDFSSVPRAAVAVLPVLNVPAVGAMPLLGKRNFQVTWQHFDQPLQTQPVGWTGGDEASGTSVAFGPINRGETRSAMHVHPPWRGGVGTTFTTYRLRLPDESARLVFYNAIRDTAANEPSSDGVTFRVWANGESIFERHTDSKTWVAGEADLSKFRGGEIELKLETHPGPKQNTTCDSAYWGDPVVIAGTLPARLSPADKEQLQARARAAAMARKPARDVYIFDLAGGNRAAVALGPSGLADSALAFGGSGQAVVLDAMQMHVLDVPVAGWPAGVVVEKVTTTRTGNRLRVAHRLQTAEGPGELVAELWSEGPGLRVRITCDRRITDLAPGPTDRLAHRVYYGHGYAIEKPEAFRAGSGGHNLATSHVGFEFDNGVALLVAADTPVDHLEVNPARKIYALHTHPDSTYTFVPGLSGALDCAIRYRPLYDKKPAPALAQKAGRYVFDLWGGRYAEDTARLQRCFDYGMTNSLVVMHVWQRWGYDYRLPDIFPPLPSLGTLEELQELGRVCRKNGVLWGLHDNYIDIYPDCDDFSYENVTFTTEGQPRKAWLNEGRDAQSYQFRPDRVKPFLRRNLDLIAPALRPNSYFVDVWTSINAFDFLDRHGNFHSKMETLRCWGEAFNDIRKACGGGPAISEAGSDQLIGWLDGADCQFLHLSATGGPFNNRLACQDWARVPWFDAVNHTRFSLHGVGYPGRYEGGRGRSLHGITSDDYLSCEILTGHALMIDLGNVGREAIRKYWLAQPFIESIALDDITRVDYADGNPHRLAIQWKSGAQVFVNRGADDWPIAGRVLPQFGYYAKNGAIESSIERLGGQVVERSSRANELYVNGRGYKPDAPLLIQPAFAGFNAVDARQFRLQVDWQARKSAPRDLQVFYHFSKPVPGRYRPAEFYGGGDPTTPTSQWQGRVTTDFTITVPEDTAPGEYAALVGLFNPQGEGGRRYSLLGDDASDRRYRIGKLIVSGEPGKITGVRFEPPVAAYEPNPRLLPNENDTDFGAVNTSGAVKIVKQRDGLLIIPLPDGPDSAVTLRPGRILGRPFHAKSMVVVDAQGRVFRNMPFESVGDEVKFQAGKDDFGYALKEN